MLAPPGRGSDTLGSRGAADGGLRVRVRSEKDGPLRLALAVERQHNLGEARGDYRVAWTQVSRPTHRGALLPANRGTPARVANGAWLEPVVGTESKRPKARCPTTTHLSRLGLLTVPITRRRERQFGLPLGRENAAMIARSPPRVRADKTGARTPDAKGQARHSDSRITAADCPSRLASGWRWTAWLQLRDQRGGDRKRTIKRVCAVSAMLLQRPRVADRQTRSTGA